MVNPLGGHVPVTLHFSTSFLQINFLPPDFAKYVGPTVKSDRNLIGPIKPTFFSDQMSAIVWDQISMFTDVRSRFPRFSFVAWFPVKVKFWFLDWITLRRPFCGKRGRLIQCTSCGAECIRNQEYEANAYCMLTVSSADISVCFSGAFV